jgi:hypothetical protein
VTSVNEDHKKELMMKAVDNIATPAELKELEKYIQEDSNLANEYKAFQKIKEVTDSIMFKELPDSYWKGYWEGIYNRLERGLGWILFSIGAMIILIYGGYRLLYDFFLSDEVSLILKLGVGVGGIGLIILLVSIVREVFFARCKERYKEVEL